MFFILICLFLLNGCSKEKPFFQAIEQSNYAKVELLLKNDFPINAMDNVGYTPLTRAIEKKDEKMVLLLLHNGADVNKPLDRTPLSMACRWGNLNVIKLLVERGALVHDKYGLRALLAALSSYDYKKTTNYLLSLCDININAPYIGDSLLIWQARLGESDKVRFLIEHGANINVRNKAEQTALLLAAGEGHPQTVKLLIDNKAIVTHRDLREILKIFKKGIPPDPKVGGPNYYIPLSEQKKIIEIIKPHIVSH